MRAVHTNRRLLKSRSTARSVKQQQANLEEAQVNLDYTNIISPVDRTVVSRNVDVGQTVAASFSDADAFSDRRT